MMAAQALIRDMTARGVILSATGDRLDVDAPGDVLTDELLVTLRSRKIELLDLLADDNPEMHDSAFFDVVIIFHGYPDGPAPLHIPQQSTPAGWEPQF